MSQETEPIVIAYRTLTERDRQGPYGALVRQVAAHPMIAGLVGGSVAILIALIRGWKGASNMPEVAFGISLSVLVVWVVLFRLMRPFFQAQTREQVEVVRKLSYDGEQLDWSESGELVKRVTRPTFRLHRELGAAEEGKACRAWVIMTGVDEQFVLETRILWSEASELVAEEHDADDLLPAHVASAFLELARANVA